MVTFLSEQKWHFKMSTVLRVQNPSALLQLFLFGVYQGYRDYFIISPKCHLSWESPKQWSLSVRHHHQTAVHIPS